jgi:uncharacterized membrane protein/protein-disulfide isomerase
MSSITNNPVTSVDSVSINGSNRVSVELGLFLLPGKFLLAFLAIPMLIAFGISIYLTYVTATASEVVGCSGGELFDCGHVIYSKWSKFLTMPVSALAVGTYAAMIVATIVTSISSLSTTVRQWAWTAVTGLAIAAACSAIYFTALQVFVLEHLCPWCLGAHTCGLIIAATILAMSRINMRRLAGVTSLAVSGLVVMAVAQINAAEPQKYEVVTFPTVASEDSEAQATETFTNSIGAGSAIESAPSDDEDFFAPPVDEDEDDSLFAPPTEEDHDDLFEPPSEDEDSLSTSNIMNEAFAVAAMLYPQVAVSMLQQEGPQEGDAALDSQQKIDAAAAEAMEALQQRAEKESAAAKAGAAKKAKRRIVSTMGGAIKLAAKDWPLDGSPDAKHIFIEMFDYTCSHCRSTSKAVLNAKKKLNDDVAVLLLPIPLCKACNANVQKDNPMHAEACQLAELSVAVWRCNREKFPEFHHWMFEGEAAPTYASALEKATAMVGNEQLQKELGKSVSKAYIQKNVQLYGKVGAGQVPKLLFPGTMVQGEFTGVDALVDLIKTQSTP